MSESDKVAVELPAGATIEMVSVPEDEFCIAMVKLPSGFQPHDHSRWLEGVTSLLRQRNPKLLVLVMQDTWSFRTMMPKEAREFARNMISFMGDDDLAAIDLHRVETTLQLTPKQMDELKAHWEKVKTQIRAPIVAPSRETTLVDFFQLLPGINDDELAVLGLRRMAPTITQSSTIESQGNIA